MLNTEHLYVLDDLPLMKIWMLAKRIKVDHSRVDKHLHLLILRLVKESVPNNRLSSLCVIHVSRFLEQSVEFLEERQASLWSYLTNLHKIVSVKEKQPKEFFSTTQINDQSSNFATVCGSGCWCVWETRNTRSNFHKNMATVKSIFEFENI